MKIIAEASINEFTFGTMHDFSNSYYIISNRIAKVPVKMASEATQTHKGNNDDDEDEYAPMITR